MTETVNVRTYGGPYPGTFTVDGVPTKAFFCRDEVGFYALVGFGKVPLTCRRGCCVNGEVEVMDYEWVATP